MFPPDIPHTRGPLDGSLYAQVKKRRGPGSTASAASPNRCFTSSPTVKTQIPRQLQPLAPTSDSSRSSIPSDRVEEHSHSETDCPVGSGGESDTRAKSRGKERDRETEILDDGHPSSPRGLRREHSCCGPVGTKCADGWERERELCLSNGHCLGSCKSIKKNPKSQTLPALPSKSVSPPPHLTQMELCHRHSAHPLPDLPWERPPPTLPCLHRPCLSYSIPEHPHLHPHPHPHSHTLPASNRLCTGEDCRLFLYSSHAPPSHLSHQSLPSSPYREMFFGSPTPSSGCPCRECSSRREHQSASVRTFHPLHPDPGVGIQRTREAPPLWESENPWEVTRDGEFWQCKPAVPAFRICHPATLNQGPNPEQPRFVLGPHQGYPSPQSLADMQDGASSGYHTPPPPRHSCPCSPYQSSPVESHGSRGYASGYHSGSTSPLRAGSPSPGRGRVPETPPGPRDQQQTEHHKGNQGWDGYIQD